MSKKLPVAIQVYGLRDLLENTPENFKSVMQTVKDLGYDGVELAGLYGLEPAYIKETLAEVGLVPISAHVAFDEMMQNLDEVIATYSAIGVKFLVMPYMAEEYRPVNPEGFAKFLPMAEQGRVCTIVNLRKHAKKLYQLLTERSPEEECFLLTTDLCPAHRKKVVEEVNQRLKAGPACWVAATQCIEAGVDFDFAALYRALAPLEAIIQAAGRCNRNGTRSKGVVTVFIPERLEGERLYPEEWYQLAAEVVRTENEKNVIDIHDPSHISRYYRHLFRWSRKRETKR